MNDKPKYNPLIHHRRSIRLKGYDYSQAGLYFITICCHDMLRRFGEIPVGAGFTPAQNITGFTPAQNITGFTPAQNITGFTPAQNITGFTPAQNITGFTPAQNITGFTPVQPGQPPITEGQPQGIAPTQTGQSRMQSGQPQSGQPQGIAPTDAKMLLNEYGTIAYNEWAKLPERFPNFELDVFQIMPNHMHGIILLNDAVGAGLAPAQSGQPQGIAPTTGATVFDIVGAYKSLVANGCLEIYKPKNETMGKLWQRNYYEHIIRNEKSYQTISNYITTNPSKWAQDKFYRK